MSPEGTTDFDELESMADGTIPASEFVGDPMDEIPTEDTTRIYIHNLNGICWNTSGGRWPYICEIMSTIQAGIACFSELNTNTNRHDIRTQMESICKEHFEQNCLVMASISRQSSSVTNQEEPPYSLVTILPHESKHILVIEGEDGNPFAFIHHHQRNSE